MKRHLALLSAAGLLLAAAPGLRAQLNIPSDGSDGVLNITTSTVIDLSLAIAGRWDTNNSANPGRGVYDTEKWAVVFKYQSVNIASNATVTFLNHPAHPPVVWLVQSNVTIDGTVDVSGKVGTGLIPESLIPTEPGRAGFGVERMVRLAKGLVMDRVVVIAGPATLGVQWAAMPGFMAILKSFR